MIKSAANGRMTKIIIIKKNKIPQTPENFLLFNVNTYFSCYFVY